MANYREDIADIELTGGSIHRSFAQHAIGGEDEAANRFGIRAFRNGVPENINGSVFGLFIRADGGTVAIESGTVEGNVAYVTLPSACYAVEGCFTLAIKVTSTNMTGTMRIVDGMVSRTSTDAIVDPGTIMPTIDDLIEAINEAVESIPADYSDLSSAVMVRSVYFGNITAAARNALTFLYDSTNNEYTVTVNKEFTCAGASYNKSVIQIGYDETPSNVEYPMPESFSNVESSTGFMFICFDLTDHTTASWKIVKHSTFVGNTSLVAIAMVYHDRAYFFNDTTKILFKNSITEAQFLNYDAFLITELSQYWNAISNTTALIRGTANYIPSEYKIIFEGPTFAPAQDVGSFDQTLRYETITIDWSQEQNPTYMRAIYYDMGSGELVAYIANNMTSDEKFQARIRKNLLALVCIVFNGTYVYTCGACIPGMWFVNGNDIYNTGSLPPDLFKAFRRVGVVGDSLSVGYMYNKSTSTATTRMLEYSWVKQVMKETDVPWLNFGTSGQSVLTWCSNETYGKVQAEASGNLCQAYIIGLGENDQSDSYRGIPLGQPSDIVDDYTHVATTYYGGYARIIQILKHLNPTCKIFCLTNPRTGGHARAEYNVAVRYIAGEYYTPNDNVFLIDLANDEGSLFNGSTFLPVDSATITGGHYSAIGYARIASIMEQALSAAIEANQGHFVDVAFIPYDTGDPTPNTMTQ